MLRSLIVQRFFTALNALLAGLIVTIAGTVVAQWAGASRTPDEPSTAATGKVAAGSGMLAPLRDRNAYGAITENGLFGPAGRFKTAGIEPPNDPVPPDAGSPRETELNLRLWGVTSLSPFSPFAAASIEDGALRGGRKLFRVNDAVAERVTLQEIHPRWVLLLNARKEPPEHERLSMDDELETEWARDGAESGRSGRATILPGERVELDRNAFVQELIASQGELLANVKPELYLDASGKVAGITAGGISDVPLAKQLGLENGDVLQTLNNERIDSQAKVLEMVQKYQNAGEFRVGILRNGKQKIITYNFR